MLAKYEFTPLKVKRENHFYISEYDYNWAYIAVQLVEYDYSPET